MALPEPEPENMRLSADQANIIKQGVVRHLWLRAAVWVFGSRLIDQVRGGDIDLYVEMASPVLLDELCCKVIQDQKLSMPVDILVRAFEDDSPIARIAREEGKRLDQLECMRGHFKYSLEQLKLPLSTRRAIQHGLFTRRIFLGNRYIFS